MKLLRLAWQLSLQEFLAYKTTSILTFILATAFFSVEVITGFVYFTMGNQLNGWHQTDYLLLVTTISNIVYLYNIFFIVGHENLSNKILTGALDYDLTRPVNSYWYLVMNRIDIPSIINLAISGGFSVILIRHETLNIYSIGLYLIAIGLGVGFIFLMNQIAISLNFWIDGFSALGGIIENATNLFSRPMPIFPQVIQIIFTFVFPILLVTNLPVMVFKNSNVILYLGYLAILEILLFIVSKLMWKYGSQHYLSAN
ncbi:ABC-2 family transporter protein [Apilactobacillus xinyiensis]|uniref:ABC-2 family transporter protein n=1 Tax=Apilactobacillus xinyiensis TaxID=2841032 RepID=UPI00200BFA57|nr:ABC transporter permease [Apilactobacillus xinyiensis]